MSYSPLIQSKRSNVVHIRSKESKENTTGYNTDLTVILKNSIACNENEEIHISVMSMEFPYSFYNVSTELENNKLVYDTTNTLTFDSRDYNIDDIVDYFNNDTGTKRTRGRIRAGYRQSPLQILPSYSWGFPPPTPILTKSDQRKPPPEGGGFLRWCSMVDK